MRNVLLATSAALAAHLLSGCFKCGGFEGAGDRMFRRGDDSMMVCSNGGFALTTAVGVTEGRFNTEYVDTGVHLRMAGGDTAMVAFTMDSLDEQTYTSPELGDDWQLATLDKYELDHAHVQCADLESRPWWSTYTLPQAHYYQLDQSQMLLCPSGTVTIRTGALETAGIFSQVFAGNITALDAAQNTMITGDLREDGTFVAGQAPSIQTWHELPVSDSHDLPACQ